MEAGVAIAGGHGGGIEDEGDDAHFVTAEQPADWECRIDAGEQQEPRADSSRRVAATRPTAAQEDIEPLG